MERLTDSSSVSSAGALLSVQSSFEPLFRRWQRRVPLDEDDARALIAMPWVRREYGREGYIAREGEPTKVCTVLLQGLAFRQKLVSDGARQIISFHIPGEFLDIQNCMLEIADHNVQALSRCNVGVVAKDALLQVMNDRPAIRR